MAGLASTIGRSASETGNTNANSALSRRGLLAGAMILGPAGTAAANVASVLATSHASPAVWDRALAAYLAAKARSDEFESAVANPVSEEFQRRAPMPARSFTVTALSGQAVSYPFDPGQPNEWEECMPPLRDPARQLRSEWEEYDRNRSAAASDLDYASVSDRSDELSQAWYEAEAKLIETPAPHVAAFAQKVIVALDDDRDANWCIEHLLADARRFAGH